MVHFFMAVHKPLGIEVLQRGEEVKIRPKLFILRYYQIQILGLPDDVIGLIRSWLKQRFYYVSVNGSESTVRVTWFGIVQGSFKKMFLHLII